MRDAFACACARGGNTVPCPRFGKDIDSNLCITKCKYCDGMNKAVHFTNPPSERRAITEMKIIRCDYRHLTIG
jgi:hypothetical protein